MSVSLLVGLLSYWTYVNIEISPVLDETSFWIFLQTFPGYVWTISTLFWISCMSVSWFVCLHPYQNWTNRYLYFWIRYLSRIFWGQSSTLVHWFQIFLNFFGDIHDMLVNWFQMILNFLHVCQSGSWYTSLMKSDNLAISPALDEISFWMFIHLFKIILIF